MTAHLLTLRVSEGSSRFILLPSHPPLDAFRAQCAARCGDDMGEAAAEALELRVVLPELLLLGEGAWKDEIRSNRLWQVRSSRSPRSARGFG